MSTEALTTQPRPEGDDKDTLSGGQVPHRARQHPLMYGDAVLWICLLVAAAVLVWLTWRLASVLAGAAQLPPYARRYFVTIAALLAAVPPFYDGIAEMRTWGGLIETLVLMLLLLLSTLQLTRRWREGASKRELALRWAGTGFIVGL